MSFNVSSRMQQTKSAGCRRSLMHLSSRTRKIERLKKSLAGVSINGYRTSMQKIGCDAGAAAA
eukprot:14359_2